MVEAKDAAEYSTVHRTATNQEELGSPKCPWCWLLRDPEISEKIAIMTCRQIQI